MSVKVVPKGRLYSPKKLNIFVSKPTNSDTKPPDRFDDLRVGYCVVDERTIMKA